MEDEFRIFLRRGGRSKNAEERVVKYLWEFVAYLKEHGGKRLDEANAGDLEGFISSIEQGSKSTAKGHLWGIAYYYEFTEQEEMRRMAGILRSERIERRPFLVKEFRGIDPEDAEKLAMFGIRNVKQMLNAGQNEKARAVLSEKSGVAKGIILELVKLSDLARIPGVKGIRARLYHDAGVDTIENMSGRNPEELREMMAEFVERTGFKGIAPLPAEVNYTVAKAKKLPRIVEY